MFKPYRYAIPKVNPVRADQHMLCCSHCQSFSFAAMLEKNDAGKDILVLSCGNCDKQITYVVK